MSTPNEFWLDLHRLTEAYAAEGQTPDERLANILNQFRQMPSIARRELLADFALVAGNLADVYGAAVSAHNEVESQGGTDKSNLREDVA